MCYHKTCFLTHSIYLLCCLFPGICSGLKAENSTGKTGANLLEVQVVGENLPYDVSERGPVALLLSRCQYPAEDGHLDAIVWLGGNDSGKPKGSLVVQMLNFDGKELYSESIASIPGTQLFVSAKMPNSLHGHAGALRVTWMEGGEIIGSAEDTFAVSMPVGTATGGSISITIPNETGVVAPSVPFTVGVPFPRGALGDISRMQLLDERGKAIPMQAIETARWSKFGSIKWALCSFSVDLAGKPLNLALRYGARAGRGRSIWERLREWFSGSDGGYVGGEIPAWVVETGDEFPRIETENLRFDAAGISLKSRDGQWAQVLEAESLRGAFIQAENDKVYWMKPDPGYQIEESGPERVVILQKGWYRDTDSDLEFCQFVNRFVIHRNSRLVKLFHTWIFTGDAYEDRLRGIGWQFRANKMTPNGFLKNFGTDSKWVSGDYLLQHDYDKFVVVRDGESVYHGERAPGVMAARVGEAGFFAVGSRDFWQNFPQEMEFAGESMFYHIWPRHGKPATNPVRAEDALRLWFAHEGEMLDFSLPFEWSLKDEFFYTTAPDSRRIAYSMRGREHEVNAQGIAKTVELWLYFDEANPESQVGAARLMEGLQTRSVRAVVDPQWVASSGAFFEMHPVDKERFPFEEAAFELHAAAPMNWVERIRFYGKWIWGDMTWQPEIEARGFGFYRGFRKAHQGWPYSWIPYARSGDARFLQFADAATRHQTDVVFCHYSDYRVPARGTNLPRPKGFYIRFSVPWASHSGFPSSRGYIDKANYILHSYYLTGYPRSKDVIEAFANAIKYDGGNNWGSPFQDETNFRPPRNGDAGIGNWHRGSVTALQTSVDLFEATFDPWFLAAAHQIAEKHLEFWRQTGWTGMPWNAGSREFLRFTGCPEYREFYLNYAKKWAGQETAFSHYTQSYPMMESAAFASLNSDNPWFARRLRAMVDDMVAGTYDGTEAHYRGAKAGPGYGTPPMYTAYLLQYLPGALYALVQSEHGNNPLGQKFFQAPTKAHGDEPVSFPEIVLQKPAGTHLPLRILVANFAGQFTTGADKWSLSFKSPGGAADLSLGWAGDNSLEPDSSGTFQVGTFEVPSFGVLDGNIAAESGGQYRLSIRTSLGSLPGGKVSSLPALDLPVSSGAVPEVFRLDDGHQIGPAFPVSRYAFQIPKDSKNLRFSVNVGGSGPVVRVSLWDHHGRPVTAYQNEDVRDGMALVDVPVTRGNAGRIWELRIAHPHSGIQFDPSMVPWVSTERQLWFNPDHANPERR